MRERTSAMPMTEWTLEEVWITLSEHCQRCWSRIDLWLAFDQVAADRAAAFHRWWATFFLPPTRAGHHRLPPRCSRIGDGRQPSAFNRVSSGSRCGWGLH